jgi:hypothetical protein
MGTKGLRGALLLSVVLAVPGAAAAQDLNELLGKGPIVSIESDANGKFAAATAVIAIERPLEEVWAVASDLAHHKAFVPKLVKTDARPVAPTASTPPGVKVLDVDFEVEMPGANPTYTFRFEVDEARREMSGHWLKGDLKGSKCRWRLVPAGERRTLLYYTVASKNFSSLAAAIEDDEQTITIGVNVSSALTVVKAVKKRAEGRAEK